MLADANGYLALQGFSSYTGLSVSFPVKAFSIGLQPRVATSDCDAVEGLPLFAMMPHGWPHVMDNELLRPFDQFRDDILYAGRLVEGEGR
jgi:hypothetical protein